MSTLINRNIVVAGHRTSMRLEPEMWDALTEICAREKCSVKEICTLIDSSRGSSSLTSAVRVFILAYFRFAAANGNQKPLITAVDGVSAPTMLNSIVSRVFSQTA